MGLLMTFAIFNAMAAICVDNVLSEAMLAEQMKVKKRLEDVKFFKEKMAELTELVWELCPSIASTCGINSGCFSRSLCASSSTSTSRFHRSSSIVLANATQLSIQREQFEFVRRDPRFGRILLDLDVSIMDQIFLFDTLDADSSDSIDMARPNYKKVTTGTY